MFDLLEEIAPRIIVVGAILGIVGKAVYDYYVQYQKAKDKSKVVWDWKAFGLTVLLSLVLSFVIYGTILARVQDLNDNVLAFSIAVQNGFFWQGLIGEIGKDTTGGE
jgi:H+/Cl- antiporter ClcA